MRTLKTSAVLVGVFFCTFIGQNEESDLNKN